MAVSMQRVALSYPVQNAFRQTQKKEETREFDLNDPEGLRKDRPAREGDDDPRCGPASLQKFDGEDLQKAERDAALRSELLETWRAQQADLDRRRTEAKISGALILDYRPAYSSPGACPRVVAGSRGEVRASWRSSRPVSARVDLRQSYAEEEYARLMEAQRQAMEELVRSCDEARRTANAMALQRNLEIAAERRAAEEVERAKQKMLDDAEIEFNANVSPASPILARLMKPLPQPHVHSLLSLKPRPPSFCRLGPSLGTLTERDASSAGTAE